MWHYQSPLRFTAYLTRSRSQKVCKQVAVQSRTKSAGTLRNLSDGKRQLGWSSSRPMEFISPIRCKSFSPLLPRTREEEACQCRKINAVPLRLPSSEYAIMRCQEQAGHDHEPYVSQVICAQETLQFKQAWEAWNFLSHSQHCRAKAQTSARQAWESTQTPVSVLGFWARGFFDWLQEISSCLCVEHGCLLLYLASLFTEPAKFTDIDTVWSLHAAITSFYDACWLAWHCSASGGQLATVWALAKLL